MNWYRVELDSSGHVIGCMQLEQCGAPEDPKVFYVWAPDEQRAKQTAYDGYLANQRRLAKERRARLASEKKCTQCGLDLTGKEKGKKCDTCRWREHDTRQRSAARKAGKEVVTPSKRAAFSETKAIRERRQRKAVLLEVKAAWRRALNAQQFLAWLDARIAE